MTKVPLPHLRGWVREGAIEVFRVASCLPCLEPLSNWPPRSVNAVPASPVADAARRNDVSHVSHI